MAKKKAAKKTAKKVSKKKTAKKAPKKKGAHGGKRRGAGRPVGSGTGVGENARVNRVAVMFSNTEISVLEKKAERLDLPISTLAYQIISRRLAK